MVTNLVQDITFFVSTRKKEARAVTKLLTSSSQLVFTLLVPSAWSKFYQIVLTNCSKLDGTARLATRLLQD